MVNDGLVVDVRQVAKDFDDGFGRNFSGETWFAHFIEEEESVFQYDKV